METSETISSPSTFVSPPIPTCCPVCMRKLRKCELGKPVSCSHVFCFTCLYEWSKNVNTCPVDRVKFNIIEVLDIEGKCSRQVVIEDHSLEQVLVDPYGLTYCEVCGQCTREDRLLLCDGCDKGFHMDCLVPALKKVPTGNWYCSQCELIVRGDMLESSDSAIDGSSSESEQEDKAILEDKQPELPKQSLALPFKEVTGSSMATPSIDENGKEFEKLSSSSAKSHYWSNSSRAQSSVSSNDSDFDFMTSRDQHPKSVASDNQHIVLKRGGYLVNKRKRKHKKLSVNLDCDQDCLISDKKEGCNFLGPGSGSRGARVPSSPRSKARTVANDPNISIRQAVIASHRCSSSQDGLVAAQRIAQGVWQAPGASTKSTRRQRRPNSHERLQNLTIPMRDCSVKLDKLPIDKSSRNSSSSLSPRFGSSHSTMLHSPTRTQPSVSLSLSPPKRLNAEKLDFSRPSTTDYVGAICQGLDNLQAKEHIFHRDGSIEAVQPKVRLPARTRKKVALEMARYSRDNEASQYTRTLSSHSWNGQSSGSHSSQDVQAPGSRSPDAQASSSCPQAALRSPSQNAQTSSSCPQDVQASSSPSQFHSSYSQPSTSLFQHDQAPNLQAPTSHCRDDLIHSSCDQDPQAPKFHHQNLGFRWQNPCSHDHGAPVSLLYHQTPSTYDTQSISIESSTAKVIDDTSIITDSTSRYLEVDARKMSKQIKKGNPRTRRRKRKRADQIRQHEHFKPQTIRQQEYSKRFKSRPRRNRSRRPRFNDHLSSSCTYLPTTKNSSVLLNSTNTTPQVCQTLNLLPTLADEKPIPRVPLFPDLNNPVHVKQEPEPQPISPIQPLFPLFPQAHSNEQDPLDQLRSQFLPDSFLDNPSQQQPLYSHSYSDSCENKNVSQFQTQLLIKSESSEINSNFTAFQTQALIKSDPPTDIEHSSERHYLCEEPSVGYCYPEPSEGCYQELGSVYQFEEPAAESHYPGDMSSTHHHYEDSTPGHYPSADCGTPLPSLHALFPRSCHSPQQSMDCSDWLDFAAEQKQMKPNCSEYAAMLTGADSSPSDMCLSSPSHFYESFWQCSGDSPTVESATQGVVADQIDSSEAQYASHKLTIQSMIRSFFHEQNDTTSSDEGMFTPVYPVEPVNWSIRSSPVPVPLFESGKSSSKKNGTMLDCQLAGEYVMQLLEHYRKRGYVPTDHMHRITEKALRKVQKTKNLVPKARVKKLVDDYIAIYTATTCLT